jgi:fructan beta-fructosidase
VNSFYGGDDSTGRLSSTPFRIERPYINFLIGGGKYPGETCMNLRVDGQVVRTVTGPNDQPGGSERLRPASWEVSEFLGREATIEIVDHRTGGWGHINVDHIVQSHERAEEGKRMEFRAEKRYLNLPVQNGAPMQRMQVLAGETVLLEFYIELAEETPDFWVFLDLAPFAGQALTLWADALDKESAALDRIYQDDAIRDSETLYRETYRPQFHFSSRRGWNNDPNGLVYFAGEYHLYYQHNPYGWKWGNMHWGHAVSRDLVHWTELPIALYPREFGDWCFSGSAVVDHKNTAGFQTGDEPALVAAYTSTGRGECIAFSNDRGRTFTEYEGNPVVRHQGRDPKLIWYAPGKHWVMAVYNEQEKSRGISFYTSNDLKDWTFQSRIDGYFECPEIFALPIDGDPARTRWVVYAADGEYAIGNFDGKTFTPESGKHRFNFGNCFYASQTFSDIPEEDGRRIQIAWGTIGHPEMPFNQQMNFPVELTLRSTPEGPRLYAEPVKEIEVLRTDSLSRRNLTIPPGETIIEEVRDTLLDIEVCFQAGETGSFGLVLRGIPVLYDAKKKELTCHDKTAPMMPMDGKIALRLLVDRLSIEIFGNGGQIYMPMGMVMEEDPVPMAITATGAPAQVESLDVHTLRSAWRNTP